MWYLPLTQTDVWRSAGAWVWAEQHYIIHAGLLSNQIFEKIIQKIYPDFVHVFFQKKLTTKKRFDIMNTDQRKAPREEINNDKGKIYQDSEIPRLCC